MTRLKYFIYSDASYSRQAGLAVSGYLLFRSEIFHEKSISTDTEISTDVFKEINNIRAEILGVLRALKNFNELKKKEKFSTDKIDIILYTDCQTIVNLPARRQKLEENEFISSRKKKLLANADLYREFYLIYDELNPNIIWVKGHSKNITMDPVLRNFQFLDRAVRKSLRALLENKEGTTDSDEGAG